MVVSIFSTSLSGASLHFAQDVQLPGSQGGSPMCFADQALSVPVRLDGVA
jgi:hypothetical protein